MKRAYWLGAGAVLTAIVLVVGLRYLRHGPQVPVVGEQAPVETGLTLRDVTLEQADEQGNLIWRVKAPEATYSTDLRTARVRQPEGEFYQDGELLYQVEAQSGEIREDGDFVFLEGDIVARGVQSNVVLKGQKLEWHPEGGLLIVEEDVTGDHPQLQAMAQSARVYDREQRMDLEGEVAANTVVSDSETEPWLKLQADALVWRWEAEEVESTQPLKVERFLANAITEVVTGDRGLVDLAAAQVTLFDNAVVQLLTLPLQVTSDRLLWNVDQEQILLERPLRMVNPDQGVVLTAQQGRLEIAAETVYLNRAVEVISDRNDGRLTSDRLTWNLQDQTVLAEGAVDYRQGNPALRVRGPRALGRIEAQTVVVSGGQVVTEIPSP